MTAASSAPRVAIDTGGTFTDAVWMSGGELTVAKVPTTPSHRAEGFESALEEVARRAGGDLAAVDYLAHGTTTATNALVEGNVAKVGLLTTAGFRDVLEIGTQRRTHLYNPRAPEPPPLVPRELRLEVMERIGPDGSQIVDLDEAQVVHAAARFAALNAEAVAVSFLFAYVDGRHERRARELLEGVLGADFPISLSSEVSPEFREYPRTSTTAVNASLLPLMAGYIDGIGAAKDRSRVAAPLNLMQSNGGVAGAHRSTRTPVNLIASGPAGGVIGARVLGRELGFDNLLTFDMGGTTADVALIVDGEPQLTYSGETDGHPIALPQIEILSVGAGAGSIARVDAFGTLSVGPESASADPGPAAYRRGGTEATVADAHIVAGSLHPDSFLGGRMPIHVDAAREAVARNVAGPLAISVEDAAIAILRIADATMVGAMRIMTVSRGHDPRDFALVAFGGAGPLHACALADELGIDTIVVPLFPGAGSAVGLLLTDARCDHRQSWIRRLREIEGGDLRRRLDELGSAARTEVLDGIESGVEVSVEYSVDMRYDGQAYELSVPLRGELGSFQLEDLAAAFNQEHERAYGHSLADEVELVTLRATAIRPSGVAVDSRERVAAPPGSRRIEDLYIAEHGRVAFERVARAELVIGEPVDGPVVIDQDDSTTVVLPGWSATEHASGAMVVRRRR